MKPNIILLVIDSLKASKIKGPFKTSLTPNIDKLLENGAYFEQAISSSNATLLSWASIFTGKFPFKTGIKSDRYNKLDSSIPTYFQVLKKSGYNLFSFLPYVSSITGLFPKFENNNSEYGYSKNLFDGVGDKIIKLLCSNKMKEPWFFYIHTHDLHFPIIVPKNYSDSKFGNNNYEKNLSATDFWIEEILSKINIKNTLVILTSDHGVFIPHFSNNDVDINFEIDGKKQMNITSISKHTPKLFNSLKTKIFYKLEEKNQKKKNKIIEKLNLKPHQKRNLLWQRGNLDQVLFDDNVHVPLLFYGFGIEHQVISQQVRLVDLMPTITELVGIKETIPDIDGQSLVDLMRGKTIPELPVFMETSQLIQKKANESIGLRTSKYKYFRDYDEPTKRVHLYDLKNDPFEDDNIAEKNPSIINELEEIIKNMQNSNKIIPNNNSNDSEKIEDELKKLGYT